VDGRRTQPGRRAKSVTREEDVDIEDSEDDVQTKLDELLGSDHDEDPDFVPVETEEVRDDNNLAQEIDMNLHLDEHPEHTRKIEKNVKSNKNPTATKSKFPEDFIPNKESLSVDDLKRVPSLWESSVAWLCPPDTLEKNVLTGRRRVMRDQMCREVAALVAGAGDPETACSLLLELLQRPAGFFSAQKVWAAVESDTCRQVHMVEELGLLCLAALESLLETDRPRWLQTVLQLGRTASAWRFDKRGWEFGLRGPPHTMTRCAQILLEAEDWPGLQELFTDFRANMKNSEGETELLLYRAAAAMHKAKFDPEQNLMEEEESFDSPGSLKLSQQEITELITRAMASKKDVDWIIPLFIYYLTDEAGPVAVREVLVKYRDVSPDHLPAHTHLLNFLSQEFRQETELLCHHYRVTATQFSFDQSVVTFCQLLTKSIEDEDLEDSFEDEHEGVGEHSKRNSKVSVYKEILVRTIKYLDYELNRDDMQCWSLLAECFNHLQSSEPVQRDFVQESFAGRGGWWVRQNFANLDTCEDSLLAKKGIAICYLYGRDNEHHIRIIGLLEQKIKASPSPSLSNVIKEFKMRTATAHLPFLEIAEPDWGGSGLGRFYCQTAWNQLDKLTKQKHRDKKRFAYFGPVSKIGRGRGGTRKL